jgi:shikimate dehydrogenase
MVEAAFAAAGVDARYVSLEVQPDELVEAVRGVRALNFAGINVTVPYKVAVVPLLDRITPGARVSGAVNCVKRESNELVGDNTDGKGFLESLREVAEPRGANAVVIGAGGAARAISAELALAGAARVTVVNRSAERGAEVAAAVAEGTGVQSGSEELTDGWAVPPDADVVVQATTVGMDDPSARLPLSWSRGSGVAADVVIAPETGFLREAREHGYATLNGLGTLVEQAVVGFRWWTGAEPDRAVMRAALERELGLA